MEFLLINHPARLPDLRPGRRARPAGPGHGLRRRQLALPGEQVQQDATEPVDYINADSHSYLRVLFSNDAGQIHSPASHGRDRKMPGESDLL